MPVRRLEPPSTDAGCAPSSWRAPARLRVDAQSLVQGLVALALNSSTSIVAGFVLGSITDTFRLLPGLLVMVPAAIGLRGNIFSAFGSRLSTQAIHTGQFRAVLRRGSVVGDNIAASLLLTLGCSVVLTLAAKAIAVAFGLANTISITDFVVISVLGGVLASIVVLGITLGVAVARCASVGTWTTSPRRSYRGGDVVTLPALFLATYLAASMSSRQRSPPSLRRAQSPRSASASAPSFRCCAGSRESLPCYRRRRRRRGRRTHHREAARHVPSAIRRCSS